MAKLNGVKVIDMVAGKIEKVAYEGAEYVRVEDALSATSEDIALCVKGWGDQNSGEYYEVVESFAGSERVYVSVNGNYGGRCVCHDTDVVIFRKVAATTLEADTALVSRVEALESDVASLKGEKEALKVGDYAKVISINRAMCGFSVGDIVEIIPSQHGEDDDDYKIEKGGLTGYANKKTSIVRATDAEVAEAKKSEASFSVGDYAKVVGETRYNDIKADTIVKVTKDIDADDEYKIKLLDDSDYDYAKPASLEKVSAEEAPKFEEESKVKAKWAEIGREVDEYKEGDIVRVIVDGVPHHWTAHKHGDIGEVVGMSISGHKNRPSVKTTHHSTQYSFVELVTPVESRFDR